jgi:hypothetical protein
MSDDNEFVFFTAAPIPAALPKQPKQKSSKPKTPTTRKKVSETETVYGEELFQSAWKPEKSVVVCFAPFTKNHFRISKGDFAGKFAIEFRVNDDGGLFLYHFFPPVADIDFDSVTELEFMFDKTQIHKTLNWWGPFDSVDEIKVKIMSIIRAEILYGKKEKVKELNRFDAALRAEKERIEDETESLTDKLAEAGILHDTDFDEPETAAEISEEIPPIPIEATEETPASNIKIVKDKKGREIKLTPIVW